MTGNGRAGYRPRALVAALVLSMVAASCGSSSGSDVTADASSTGVAREFCAAIASLGDAATTHAATTSAATTSAATTSAATTSAAINEPSGTALVNTSAAARELLPADAPDYAAAYLNAITESALAGDGPSGAWADAQHLQFAAYLGQQCPSAEFTDNPNFLGAIDVGLAAGQGVSPAGEDSGANTVAPSTTVTAAAPPATAAPGEGPSSLTDIGTTNPSAVYSEVRISVLQTFSSNAKRAEIFEDFSLASTEAWLIVEIDTEALSNISATFSADDFLLSAPTGRTTVADRFTDRFGDTVSTISLDGRESKRAFVLFSTDQLIADLTGWSLILEIDDEVPQWFPFSGELPINPYPVSLATDGATGITEGSNTWGSTEGCISEYEVELLDATVAIDADYGISQKRADLGDRFLRVDVSIRNVTSDDQDSDLCGLGSTSGFESSSLRFLIDGRPIGAVDDPSVGSIDQGSSGTVTWHYLLTTEVQEVSMVGDTDDKVFKTWQLNLPALRGE